MRILVVMLLCAASGCVDPCSNLVDKVCGPGESERRQCWDSTACHDARDIRDSTALTACTAALGDEEHYPRCPSCREKPPKKTPDPLPDLDPRTCAE